MDTLNEIVNSLLYKGHSQADIAKVARVSQMTISRWSRTNPTLVNVKAIERLKRHFFGKKKNGAT